MSEDDNGAIRDAVRGEADAQTDDDQRWIETVMASLSIRPRAAREALAQALLDGESSENSQFSSPNLSVPVGCTIFLNHRQTGHLMAQRERRHPGFPPHKT